MKYLLLKQSGAQAFKCYLPVFRCTPSLQSLPSVASWTGIYTSPQTKLIHFFFSLYLFANTFSILWLDEPFTCFAPRSNHSFSVSLSLTLFPCDLPKKQVATIFEDTCRGIEYRTKFVSGATQYDTLSYSRRCIYVLASSSSLLAFRITYRVREIQKHARFRLHRPYTSRDSRVRPNSFRFYDGSSTRFTGNLVSISKNLPRCASIHSPLFSVFRYLSAAPSFTVLRTNVT